MTQYFKTADGQVHEFPDDATPEEIDAATRSLPRSSPTDYPIRTQGPKPDPFAGEPAVSLTEHSKAGDFLFDIAHNLAKAPVGIAQLAANVQSVPMRAAAAMFPDSAGGRLAAKFVAPVDALNRGVANEEQVYQSGPNNAAAKVGGFVGNVAPFFVGGPARALSAIGKGAESLLPKVASSGLTRAIANGAAQGAAVGASQPVTSGDFIPAKAEQVAVGMGLGGLLPGLGKVTGGTLKWLLNPSGSAAGRLADAAGTDPAMLAQLRAQPPVAGTAPSVAEMAPTPANVQMERMLRAKNGVPFAQRDVDNNAARLAHLDKLAGTDPELQAAIDARSAATQPFRNAHLPETGSKPLDPAPVVAKLEMLAKSANAVVRAAAKEHLGLIADNTVDGKIPAYNLEDIRQNVGSMLAKYAPHGAVGTAEQAKYGPVQTAITDTLDAALPGYRDYLVAYAKHSQPITDMESARAIMGKALVGGHNPGGDPVLSLANLKTALRGDDRARYGMSDPARSQIEALLQSLQGRSALNNVIGNAGPGTAESMLGVGAHFLPGGPLATLARGLGSLANKRSDSALADLLLNPAKAAKALEARNNPRLQALMQSRFGQAFLPSAVDTNTNR